jgi:hypothetical protein
MNRVVANDAAGPAFFDKLVTGDDITLCLRKRDQHLHDARLQGLALGAAFELKRWRRHIYRAKPKRRDPRDIYCGGLDDAISAP